MANKFCIKNYQSHSSVKILYEVICFEIVYYRPINAQRIKYVYKIINVIFEVA